MVKGIPTVIYLERGKESKDVSGKKRREMDQYSEVCVCVCKYATVDEKKTFSHSLVHEEPLAVSDQRSRTIRADAIFYFY